MAVIFLLAGIIAKAAALWSIDCAVWITSKRKTQRQLGANHESESGLITHAAAIALLRKIAYKFDSGLQAAIAVQIDPAIARRMIGEGKIIAALRKLHTA